MGSFTKDEKGDTCKGTQRIKSDKTRGLIQLHTMRGRKESAVEEEKKKEERNKNTAK